MKKPDYITNCDKCGAPINNKRYAGTQCRTCFIKHSSKKKNTFIKGKNLLSHRGRPTKSLMDQQKRLEEFRKDIKNKTIVCISKEDITDKLYTDTFPSLIEAIKK